MANRWQDRRRLQCQRCAGKGKYRLPYGDRKGEIVTCKVCGGSGRLDNIIDWRETPPSDLPF